MFKKIVWVLSIIVILIIITTFLGYYAFFEKAASPVSPVSRDKSLVTAVPLVEEKSIEIEESKFSSEKQGLLLANQQENLEKIQREIKGNIELALQEINEKYLKKIDEKNAELMEEINDFAQVKKQELRERLTAKKELYQRKIDKMASEIKDEKSAELLDYHDQLTKRYYHEILNYNLKLELLELTAVEKEKYEAELEKIKKEKERLLAQKEEELKELSRKDIAVLENDYNQKMISFRKELEAEMNEQIVKKETAVKDEMLEYAALQHDLMSTEMEEKKTELLDRGKKELAYQQSIVQDLKKEYERMQNG